MLLLIRLVEKLLSRKIGVLHPTITSLSLTLPMEEVKLFSIDVEAVIKFEPLMQVWEIMLSKEDIGCRTKVLKRLGATL